MKVFIVLMALLLNACSMVGPGEKAIHTRFGLPTSESESGITFWIPFLYGVEKFDLRVQKHVIETTAASKDLQPLTSHIAINWRIDAAQVTSFYKDVGEQEAAVEKVLHPAVNEVFKAATAKLSAENVVSRRMDLKNEIDDLLNKRLARYFIKIDEVSIIDIDFSKEFVHAIEQKQIAEQQKEQAQYIADKAIKDAEAEVNRARGQAEAQRLLQSSLSPAMLKKLYIEKWDGKLPKVQSGNGTLLNIKLDE